MSAPPLEKERLLVGASVPSASSAPTPTASSTTGGVNLSVMGRPGAGADAKSPLIDRKHHAEALEFTATLGEPIPFIDPNIKKQEDLLSVISAGAEPDACTYLSCVLCSLTGIGACYVCAKQKLIDQGEYGFTSNNGKPEIYLPGRHFLMNPLNSWVGVESQSKNIISRYPITIVRVPVGTFALANNNAHPEILLPGIHARNNGLWRVVRSLNGNARDYDGDGNIDDFIIRTDTEWIDFGPVKFLTVKSGSVQVGYMSGKVQIFPEGRFAINDPTFVRGPLITTQQQNMLFQDHQVILDGGIQMLVKGLLTYQVADVEKLIKKLGDRDLARAVQDVSKAELSRVFSSIHLEQISSASSHPSRNKEREAKGEMDSTSKVAQGSLLGGAAHSPSSERSLICEHVVQAIQPIVFEWGVHVINFQLESMTLADRKYAREYEEASLAMAKAKANLRAVSAENEVLLNKATAAATASKIEAEGAKASTIIRATGEAEARKIEAEARNKAAQAMTDDFARDFALAGQQVEFARALKAQVLTLLPDSAIGKPFTAQSMFNPRAPK